MTMSVAMATYNGATHLEAQLRSIAVQTVKPLELCVGDDRSTDSTVQILEAFSRSVQFPVRVTLNRSRLGYIQNFLQVARECRGELIAFCDQDDVWHPEKIERCSAALRSAHSMLSMHGADVVDGDLKPLNIRLPNIRRRHTATRCRLNLFDASPGFALVFRRGLLELPLPEMPLEDHMGPGEAIGHDHFIWFLATALGNVELLPERLASYRRHNANTTSPVQRGVRRALHLAMTTGTASYQRTAALCDERMSYLKELARRVPKAACWQIELAIERYDFLANRMRHRAKLHDRGLPRVARARSFAWLNSRWCYGSMRAGGLGLRGLVKDSIALLT